MSEINYVKTALVVQTYTKYTNHTPLNFSLFILIFSHLKVNFAHKLIDDDRCRDDDSLLKKNFIEIIFKII